MDAPRMSRDTTARYPVFCAKQHVCSAALAHAPPLRAQWITRRLDMQVIKKRLVRPKVLPQCEAGPLPPFDEFSASQRNDLLAGLSSTEPLLHFFFIDDRPKPSLDQIAQVARQGNGSRVRFVALLMPPTSGSQASERNAWSSKTSIEIVHIDLPSLPPLAKCLHAGLRRMVPRQSNLRTGAMLKPVLHALLPARMRIALTVDTDMVPMRSFDELLGHVAAMRRQGAFVGMVVEQSRFYTFQHAEVPDGLAGFNSGITLQDLASMRQRGAWAAAVDAYQAGRLYAYIGAHGDQGMYNGLVALFPHFFYRLPCEWNRQLGSWSSKSPWARPSRAFVREDLDLDAEVHACPARCALLHANGPGLKCFAGTLLSSAASCSAWSSLLDRLQQASNGTCPSRETYKTRYGGYVLEPRDGGGKRTARRQAKQAVIAPQNRSWTSRDFRRLTKPEHGRALAAAFRRWFGDCCIRSV